MTKFNSLRRFCWQVLITFIPSSREMARSGLNARNVRRERNTDKFLFSNRQASEICEVKHILSAMRLSSLYTNVCTVRSELNNHILLTETIKASRQFQGEAKYLVRPKAMALSRNSSVKTHAKM